MPSSDNNASFRKYAGTVIWPTTPEVLTDTTRCPACLAPLHAIVCSSCGLDLSHPAAAELAQLSQDAAATLARRVDLIGRIRYETSRGGSIAHAAARAAAPVAAAVTAPAPVLAPVHPPVVPEVLPNPTAYPAAATAASTAAAPDTSAPASAPRPARRSSVQVILLIVGISLLSIFAIFFLVYAFINYGIVWRSIIIATITIAAFVAASLLRRRSLNASAEGVAVFALVLIYLDAYAVRANDFFNAGAVEGEVFWGAVLTLASLGFIGWHRLSAVRSASIVGWATLSPGIGLLVWGLADGLEPTTRAFAAILASAIAGLTHALIRRAAFSGLFERMLLLATSFVALSAAFLVGFAVAPDNDWGGTIACAIIAGIALVHATVAGITSEGTTGTRTFGHPFAVIGGVSAASAFGAAAVRIGPEHPGFAIFVPTVAAAAVVLAFESGALRFTGSTLRQVAAFGAWGSLAVFALTMLLPLATATWPTGVALSHGLADSWERGASDRLSEPVVESAIAVLALAGVLALAAIAWTATGALRRRGPVLAWGASVTLVLAVGLLDTVWLVLAGWLLLAVASLVVLVVARGSSGPLAQGSPYRACLAAVLATATALVYASGWVSLDTWATTTVATIVILLASRIFTPSVPAKAALLGTAIGVALLGAAAATRHLTWNANPGPIAELANISAVVGLLAAAVLVLSAFSYPTVVTALDRRVAFWISAVTAGVCVLVTGYTLANGRVGDPAELLLPQYGTSLVSSLLLLGSLMLWIALRGNSALRLERIAASIAIGPVVYWAVDSFAQVLALPELAQSVVPITAGLLTAAGALAISLLRRSTRPTIPRWAREVGVALVAVPAVLSAVVLGARGQGPETGWLVLVIAAVTVLLMAISPDGLFSSTSARRYLGWPALALATAGLWWRLSSDRIEAVEPYVLPLSGALIVIALLSAQAARRSDAPADGKAAPLVALAGLLIGILPIALNSVTGELSRAIVIFVVSAALLLGGSVLGGNNLKGTTRARPYLDAAALAGGIGVLVTFTGRALLEPKDDLTADAWLAIGLVTLIVAAFGQARLRSDANEAWHTTASHALGLIGMTAVLVVEVSALGDTTLGFMRAIAMVLLFGALHVIAFLIDRAPFTRTIAWVSITFAGIAAIAGLATDALDPLELGTVPIAIALLASGTTRLATHPASRSWPWLAPGIAALLVPSLLATAGSPDLWRLVALGIVALAVLLVGVIRRLQAPFILGVVVALIHGFATFAPQIRAVYESAEWWVWAGAGGILLLVLAIRYEQRIQNFKSVAMRITALR